MQRERDALGGSSFYTSDTVLAAIHFRHRHCRKSQRPVSHFGARDYRQPPFHLQKADESWSEREECESERQRVANLNADGQNGIGWGRGSLQLRFLRSSLGEIASRDCAERAPIETRSISAVVDDNVFNAVEGNGVGYATGQRSRQHEVLGNELISKRDRRRHDDKRRTCGDFCCAAF